MQSVKIKVNKASQVPIYKQIVDQISELSESGVIKAGDKLPTEKEFFQEYGIARGTVKRAYDQLVKKGMITVIRGKGAYLLRSEPNTRTIDIIDSYLDQLQDLSLGLEEIELFVAQKLQERGEKQHIVRVAVIESCPELMNALLEALSVIPEVDIEGVDLEQARQSPQQLFQQFDLILGTESNIQLLLDTERKCDVNLIPIVALLSGETLQKLAAVRPGSSVGVFCRSRRYSQIIRWELASLNGQLAPRGVIHATTTPAVLEDFLRDKDVLLITHGYEVYASERQQQIVREFGRSGKQLIRLEHVIDRGSFMYVEECIRKFRLSNYDLLR